MTAEIPTLLAYYGPPRGFRDECRSLYVWCDYCIRWHIHGGPNAELTDIAESGGHRYAHCAPARDRHTRPIQLPLSPYDVTGYNLAVVGPLTPEIQAVARARARTLKLARTQWVKALRAEVNR